MCKGKAFSWILLWLDLGIALNVVAVTVAVAVVALTAVAVANLDQIRLLACSVVDCFMFRQSLLLLHLLSKS